MKFRGVGLSYARLNGLGLNLHALIMVCVFVLHRETSNLHSRACSRASPGGLLLAISRPIYFVTPAAHRICNPQAALQAASCASSAASCARQLPAFSSHSRAAAPAGSPFAARSA